MTFLMLPQKEVGASIVPESCRKQSFGLCLT
jgi:hypothetical protein